jgi:hypothetical protein
VAVETCAVVLATNFRSASGGGLLKRAPQFDIHISIDSAAGFEALEIWESYGPSPSLPVDGELGGFLVDSGV